MNYRIVPGVLIAAMIVAIGVSSASAAVIVGLDETANANWRTSAQFEVDSEYGTDGYVIYGLDATDGTWVGLYDATSIDASGLAYDQASLPSYISGVSMGAAEGGMWSGNGNFGMIEDPAAGNALTATPLLTESIVDGDTFTMNGDSGAPYRLTVMLSDGDNRLASWDVSVTDMTGMIAAPTYTHTTTPGLVYSVFDVVADTQGVVTVDINNNATNNGGGHHSVTGFAFDNGIPEPSTFALLGVALAGLFGFLRRRER